MDKKKTYTYKVPTDFEGKVRLREFVKGLFPYLETGSAVKKAIQKQQITLNNKIGNTGDWVTAGSEIVYEWLYPLVDNDKPTIDIHYEDEDLMVVRKPPGVASSGNRYSFQQTLQAYQLSDTDGSLPFPYLVHRLDKATEGLMLAAKTMNARRLLGEMIANGEITKHYVLIVEGVISESRHVINTYIKDKPAKTEIIEFAKLKTKDPTSRVLVRLHTGRTHQIRRHFKSIGHPIVGDVIYNYEGLNFGTGLLLCAYHLEFLHPITQKYIVVELPIPSKISKYKSLSGL